MIETIRQSAGVDLLPTFLWRGGNLILAPGGDLHFCTGSSDEYSSVRTIEWNGRELVRGLQPVDHRQLEHSGAIISRWGRGAQLGAVALGCALFLVL